MLASLTNKERAVIISVTPYLSVGNPPQDVAPFPIIGEVAGLHRDQSPAFRLEVTLDKAFCRSFYFCIKYSILYLFCQ